MSSWTGIDEFLGVASTRSFVQAARRLGCSTSRVSREISNLEDRLGQRLLYRTTRHVSLTEAGELFFHRCRRLQEDRDDAIATLQDGAHSLQGHLRMTCAVTFGERFIAPLVNSFMLDHPGMSVEMILTNEVVDLVDKGLDLAIRFGRLADSRLVATRLGSRTWRLCAAPSYLQAHGDIRSLEDLSHHASLRGTAESWSFQAGGRLVQHRISGRLRCNSGQAVLNAALEGLGLCQLPDFYVHDHIEKGELVELLSEQRPPEEGIWAVYPGRKHLPQKVRLFVERLQARFGKPVGKKMPFGKSAGRVADQSAATGC
jgi:DNA-binding transcriptional LysR family regulator